MHVCNTFLFFFNSDKDILEKQTQDRLIVSHIICGELVKISL